MSNRTGIRKMDHQPDLDTYKPNRKSQEIIRMSCLRSASKILNGLYIDPDMKTDKALDIAKQFEKYVTGIEGDEGDGQK